MEKGLRQWHKEVTTGVVLVTSYYKDGERDDQDEEGIPKPAQMHENNCNSSLTKF